MPSSRSFAFAFALGFAVITLVAGPSRADIAPRDACNTVGAACNTAGPEGNSPGVCVTKTCSRTLPPTVPGGPPTMSEFSCQRCELRTADASADSGTGDRDDDACSYGGAGATSGRAALAGVFAAFFAFAWRRSRRRR